MQQDEWMYTKMLEGYDYYKNVLFRYLFQSLVNFILLQNETINFLLNFVQWNPDDQISF